MYDDLVVGAESYSLFSLTFSGVGKVINVRSIFCAFQLFLSVHIIKVKTIRPQSNLDKKI